MLAAFHRWLHEQKLSGSVLTLRTFILQESEFEIIAEETTRGFNKSESKTNVFVTSNNGQNNPGMCIVCQEAHSLKDCPKFHDANLEERSNMVHKFGLCFECLGSGHLKKDCKHKIRCQKCGKNHNVLFHREILPSHFHGQYNSLISLRTLTVKLSHRGKEIFINAILDAGSSQSFINSDVANYLGLTQTNQQHMAVGVLNGAYKSFSSSCVSVKISSDDKNKPFQIDLMTIKM